MLQHAIEKSFLGLGQCHRGVGRRTGLNDGVRTLRLGISMRWNAACHYLLVSSLVIICWFRRLEPRKRVAIS